MGVAEQTRITLECFPDLTKTQTDKIISEWAENEYADTWDGHTQAQSDLMELYRWESLSVSQREQETKRLRKG